MIMLKKYVIKISFQQKVKLVFPASLYFCNVLLQQTFFQMQVVLCIFLKKLQVSCNMDALCICRF